MITLPEGLNFESQGDVEQKLAELQRYVRYMTEQINKAVLELADRVRELEEGAINNGN